MSDKYSLTQIQETVRDAMQIREDSFQPNIDPKYSVGKYRKTIEIACSEACFKHGTQELFLLIYAAVSGGWNECDAWVYPKPGFNSPSVRFED